MIVITILLIFLTYQIYQTLALRKVSNDVSKAEDIAISLLERADDYDEDVRGEIQIEASVILKKSIRTSGDLLDHLKFDRTDNIFKDAWKNLVNPIPLDILRRSGSLREHAENCLDKIDRESDT